MIQVRLGSACAVCISPLWAPPPPSSTWRAASPCWPWRTDSACSACPCVRACAPVLPHHRGPPPTPLRRPCLPPLGVDEWADHACIRARDTAQRGSLPRPALVSCTDQGHHGRAPPWSRAPCALRASLSPGFHSRGGPRVLLSPNVCLTTSCCLTSAVCTAYSPRKRFLGSSPAPRWTPWGCGQRRSAAG